MTLDSIITLAILAGAILFFLTEWLRVDVVALAVVVSLALTGILTPSESIAGFSSTAVLTISALFIVGGSVMQTGLAAMIGERILKIAGKDETRLTVVIMLTVALLSGFMSDTGTVAVLLPAIIALAASAKISPSRLLIPLSYGSLLGGSMTLIGTPPNIIVSDLLREEGMESFGFFSYTPMGIILLVAGMVFMLTVGRRLLPVHHEEKLDGRVSRPVELLDIYHLPDDMCRLRVTDQSSLNGLTLKEANLRHDSDLVVLEIQRHPDPQVLVKLWGEQVVRQSTRLEMLRPSGSTVIQTGDILLVQGEQEAINKALTRWNLVMLPESSADQEAIINQEGGVAEVLVRPRSAFAGKTLSDIRFGTRFRLIVLAIRRPGTDETLDPAEAALKPGDILLVQGRWKDVLRLKQMHRPDFVVLGQPEIEEMMGAPHRRRAPIALLILLGMLVLMILDLTAVSTASLLAALMMVLTGCLTMDEAYEAIDWKSVFLIAGMLPMATALESVGLIDDVADLLTNNLGDSGPLIVLGSLFLFTALFTQVLSNTATTVLVAPIGLATARELDVEPQAFLMAIAIAASMAFASPVASPVNTLVMGAGHYKFSDYMKVGLPLMGIMMVLSLIFLPLIFPF